MFCCRVSRLESDEILRASSASIATWDSLATVTLVSVIEEYLESRIAPKKYKIHDPFDRSVNASKVKRSMPEAKSIRQHTSAPRNESFLEVEITEADILAFARLTGDHNPLHVDAEYARSSNYQGRIVHGAFQVGLASALLGMHLPGKKVLLGTINARFPSPLYFPCSVKVTGEIASWNDQNSRWTAQSPGPGSVDISSNWRNLHGLYAS